MQARACLWGNAHAVIDRPVRNGRRKIALLPIPPDSTYTETVAGELVYVTVPKDAKTGLQTGKELVLRTDQVLHIRGMGDGVDGMSVIGAARDSLGLGLAAQKHGSRTFKNGLNPSVVLEHPESLGKDGRANLRRSWQETYGGSDNAGKAAVLEEGLTLKPFSMSHDDAQFLETREFEIRQVANWFGVPPHKLGDSSKSSYNSLEQENQAFLDDALDHWLVNWECECREKLLSDSERENDTHYVEFNRNALVRVDFKARMEGYAIAIDHGIYSPDDVLKKENENPRADGHGHRYLRPMNMAYADEPEVDPDGDTNGAPISEGDANRVAALEGVLNRMARRISHDSRKKARNHPGEFPHWIAMRLRGDHEKTFDATVEPIANLAEVDFAALSERFFEEVRARLDTTCDVPLSVMADRVPDAIDANELSRTLALEFTGENHGT